jgi:hypothetical protein
MGILPRPRPDLLVLQQGSRFYQVLHPYAITLEAFCLGDERATGTILSFSAGVP